MKYKNLVLVVAVLGLFICKITFASDPDCLKTLTNKIVPDSQLQTVFENYTDTTKYSKQMTGGTYTLCFDPNKQRVIENSLTLTASASAPLLIYGLNITSSASPAIKVTGSDVTLHTIKVTGNDTGVGLLFTGPNHSVIGSTIQKLATGIQLGTADSAASNVTIGSADAETNIAYVNTGVQITNAADYDINNIKFTINTGGKKVDPAYIFETAYFGIKCSNIKKVTISGIEYEVCDSSSAENIVKKVVGRAPLDTASCSGDVEKGVVLYKKYTDESVAYCKFEASSADIVLIVPSSDDSFTLGNTIKTGDCRFECAIDDGKLALSNMIGLKYVEKNADGQTKILGHGVFYDLVGDKEYYNYWKYLFTASGVQSTGLGGIAMIGTVSEATGGGESATETEIGGGSTADIPDCATTNNCTKAATASNDGGGTIDSGGSSGTAFGTSAAGCAISTAVSANTAQMLLSLIFLLGLPVIVVGTHT